MKHIKSFINEGWEFLSDLHNTKSDNINIPKEAKWLLINTEGEMISAITENDLDSFEDDFNDKETAQEVKKLKIGESYDADGGINIYIRIKK